MLTATDISPASPASRRVLGFVFLTVFLDLMGFGIILPLLPFYVQSMGGSAQTVGFLLASFSVTQLLATPLLGRLSDRVGRRPVILLSLVGNVISMLVFALATKLTILPILFASRILAGATAGNLAACQATIADVTSKGNRAKGMGQLGAAIGLGLVLGPVLGGMVSHFGPWAPPLGAAAFAFADLVGAFFLMPETYARALRGAAATALVNKQSNSLWQVLSERRLVILLLLYFLVFLCMTNLQVALALLANERLHWGENEIGHVFGLYGMISLVVQGGLIGRLSQRFKLIHLLIAGSLFLTIGLTSISIAHHAILLLCGLAIMGIGFGMMVPLLSSLGSDLAGQNRQGAVLGFAQSAGGLARAIGPIWSGWLFTRIGSGAPFAAGAVAAVVSAALSFGLRGNQNHESS